jgi:hypothetical protein
MKNILVAFRIVDKDGDGAFGNAEAKVPALPLSAEDIREIEDNIIKRNQAKCAIVLNIIELRSDNE